MHDNRNNISLAYHSDKKGLYTWHSNVHAISVDFLFSLAKGGHGPMPPPPRIYASAQQTINMTNTFYIGLGSAYFNLTLAKHLDCDFIASTDINK